ncbi:MAG: hypothetical protein GTO41_11495, partial [Burkholderiales bacterium]|nr:hypothetical protein [Burkholderiales bacterium]
NFDFDRRYPIQRLPYASDAEYERADAIARDATRGYSNLPTIHMVKDMAELPEHIVTQIVAEGGSLQSVRGY